MCPHATMMGVYFWFIRLGGHMSKPMPITYQLDFSRFRLHLVDVTLRFIAPVDNPVLWLPTWIAGSYLVREFARHIGTVTARVGDDLATQRLVKLDKNHWQVQAGAGDLITVNYEVYAYDLSVRGAYVDETRLYGNFAVLALAVQGLEQSPITVDLLCPLDFVAINGGEVGFACALPSVDLDPFDDVEALAVIADADGQTFDWQDTEAALAVDDTPADDDETADIPASVCYCVQADDYEQFIDSPFEIAEQRAFDFVVQAADRQVPHRFVISGVFDADLNRLQQDLTQICQTYVDWLGDTPFADYVFLTMATDNDYGGLEHAASTSLITPRDDLPSVYEPAAPSDNYQRFLGLCSHEYFHAWWVKTVRPDVMLTDDLHANLTREAYTPLLWVFEGFTSYIDDFMLQAAGVIAPPRYVSLLAEQINRYHQTAGRTHQSVAESSFDAWIKLYRSDENSANAGVSYYNKGALVAFGLDVTLMQHNGRLFDVVQALYQRSQQADTRHKRLGLSVALLDTVMAEFLPDPIWQDFKARYIDGTDELPLADWLDAVGVTVSHERETSAGAAWGIRYSSDAQGIKLQRVLRDGVAAQAGLSAHDVIIAIDGLKASEKRLTATTRAQAVTGNASLCHVFRRDELLLLDVPAPNATQQPVQKWQLGLTTDDTAAPDAPLTAAQQQWLQPPLRQY